MSYVVPDNYDLYKNSLNLNNIETSENGVKIIPFDPFNEEMEIQNKNNLKISLEKKNSNLNSEQKNSKNVPNQKPLEIKIDLEEIFNSLDGQNNHKKINLEEIKKWFITTSSAKNIGPYNGKEMLECLKHILIENSLIKNSENSKGFMICDSESDIYYKPEVAIEIIQREISESTSTLLEKKYNFEKQIKLNNLQFPSHIMHNMLHPTTHMHSQNLIERRFHEYFGIYNHSSIKNKFDLIEPKFDFKNLQNITFENKLQSLLCAPKEKENFDFSNHKKNMLNFRKKSNENSRNKFDYPNKPLNFNSNIYNKKGQKLEQSIYNYK